MRKTIDAVYEKGVIKPVKPLSLPESKKLRVTIDTAERIVAATTSLIKADADLVQQVAESDEYLYDSSTPSCS
jgi:predicted DNA-binding antitoxin AbrB/MazE fold protein